MDVGGLIWQCVVLGDNEGNIRFVGPFTSDFEISYDKILHILKILSVNLTLK